MERMWQRMDDLVAQAIGSWQERGYRVVSPVDADARSGVFVLQLPEGLSGRAVYDALRSDHDAFTSPVDGPRDLRIAIHFFNTKDEIEATFDAIESLV